MTADFGQFNKKNEDTYVMNQTLSAKVDLDRSPPSLYFPTGLFFIRLVQTFQQPALDEFR